VPVHRVRSVDNCDRAVANAPRCQRCRRANYAARAHRSDDGRAAAAR
jgi:hypothetical protein